MIYIQVVDLISREGVADVVVRLLTDDTPPLVAAEGVSGEDGRALVDIAEGTYELRLFKAGYRGPLRSFIDVPADPDPSMVWTGEVEDMNAHPQPTDAALCRVTGAVVDGSSAWAGGGTYFFRPVYPRVFRGLLVQHEVSARVGANGRADVSLIRGGVYAVDRGDGQITYVLVPQHATANLADLLFPEPDRVEWEADEPGTSALSVAEGSTAEIHPEVILTSGQSVPFTWPHDRTEEGVATWVALAVDDTSVARVRWESGGVLLVVGVAPGVTYLRAADLPSRVHSRLPGAVGSALTITVTEVG